MIILFIFIDIFKHFHFCAFMRIESTMGKCGIVLKHLKNVLIGSFDIIITILMTCFNSNSIR